MAKEHVPKKFFLTNGKATSDVSALNAFHEALRKAHIQYQNIVSVSSIIPDSAIEIPAEEGVKLLDKGEVTYSVIARQDGMEGQAIASGVAYAWLKSKDENKKVGIAVEDHGYKRERTTTPDLIHKVVNIAEVEGLFIYSKENPGLEYLKGKKDWVVKLPPEITLDKLEKEYEKAVKEYSKYLLDNFKNYGKTKIAGFDDIEEHYGCTVAAIVFIL